MEKFSRKKVSREIIKLHVIPLMTNYVFWCPLKPSVEIIVRIYEDCRKYLNEIIVSENFIFSHKSLIQEMI